MLLKSVVLSYLAAIVAVGWGQTCTKVGLFRNPIDCTKFYKCVGLWQNSYHFNCPPGLVFDETISNCNWPYQAAPCKSGPAFGGGAVTQAPQPVEPGGGGGGGGGGGYGGGGTWSVGITPGESHYLISWL